MATAAHSYLFTASDLLRMPDDGFRYELVRGELRRMTPAGEAHGRCAMKLGWRLARHVETAGLGVVYAAETGFLLASSPDTVRAPDAAFVRAERIAGEGGGEGYRLGAPDLAVEVVSPHDGCSHVEEVEEKVHEYLAAGALAVWLLDPRRRTVTVYRSLADIAILTERDELEGGEVVPGFRCRVSEIFP